MKKHDRDAGLDGLITGAYEVRYGRDSAAAPESGVSPELSARVRGTVAKLETSRRRWRVAGRLSAALSIVLVFAIIFSVAYSPMHSFFFGEPSPDLSLGYTETSGTSESPRPGITGGADAPDGPVIVSADPSGFADDDSPGDEAPLPDNGIIITTPDNPSKAPADVDPASVIPDDNSGNPDDPGRRGEDPPTIAVPVDKQPYIPPVNAEPLKVPSLPGGSGIVKISCHLDRFAAIDGDGKVYVWGADAQQMKIPSGLPSIIDIGIGYSHVVALDTDGNLHGWGTQYNGELDYPSGLPKIVAISVNGCKTMALTEDGQVLSWGNANQGSQYYVPSNMGRVVKIAAGPYTSAAYTQNGTMYTWGGDSKPVVTDDIAILAPTENSMVYLTTSGEIRGDISPYNLSRKFFPKPEMTDVKAIFSSYLNLAAIDSSGKVNVWGDYDFDQRGRAHVDIPVNLPRIKTLALGYNCIACVGEDGKVYQWGGYTAAPPDAINGFLGKFIQFAALDAITLSDPAEVRSVGELIEAVQNDVSTIIVAGDFDASGSFLGIGLNQTIVINKGVTLTVSMYCLEIYGNIINNGKIIVSGRLIDNSSNLELGDIKTKGNGVIDKIVTMANVGDIEKYLSADSAYVNLSVTPANESKLLIDRDLTIPKGKTLWLNSFCTLQVNEGVTLTILGIIETHNKPIIKGTVVGTITVN